jgi:hypothetical protein
MFGWLLENVLGFIPWFAGRVKQREIAQSKLQYLRSTLIFYSSIAASTSSKLDVDHFQWSIDSLQTIPEEYLAPKTTTLIEIMEAIVRAPMHEAVFLYDQYRERRSNETKIFPELEMPDLGSEHLSKADNHRINVLTTKVASINSAIRSISSLHEKTYDNSLNQSQRAGIQESMSASYETLSTQAQLGADIIKEFDVIDLRKP